VRSRQDFNGCGVVGVFDAAYLPALQRLTDAELLELRTGCGIGARHVTDRSLYQAVDLAFVGELGTRGYLPLESLFRQHDPQSLTVAQEVLHSIDPTQPIFLDPLAEEAFHARGLEYFGAQVEYLENRATALRRRHFLEPLAAQGLKIFGDAEWSDPALAGPLTQAYTGRRLNYTTQLPNLYASAKINLNIFHVQCVAAPNPRVYDVLACGGFLLTSANQGLTDEFEAGRELVVFHDRQELREQVEYYLSHPQEREEIARRGQAKVLAKYGYQDRMQTLLTTLISNRGEPYVYICR
jgi:hypothetical protein